MGISSKYSQLCRLIDHSLRPYTDSEQIAVSLTKEKEKTLLIVLSQVLSEIQLWTSECDGDSDNDTEVKAPVGESNFSGVAEPHSEDHQCLITADLTVLLAVKSKYVQHLAGNILVAISEFVVASGSNWDKFIHLLCVLLELAICNILSSSFEPLMTRARYRHCNTSSFIVALKQKIKNANWSLIAGILRVLRIILKHMKQEAHDQLFEVYLDSISSFLSNVRWDLLDDLHIGGNDEALKSSCGYLFHNTNSAQQESRALFYGNLVQLLCSLVEGSYLVEVEGSSPNKHPVICAISNLVPKLLAWCLSKGNFSNMSIYQYFRHKILMLMIRLSFQDCLEDSVLVSWLQLMHEYFQSLLLKPLNIIESNQNDCLEGSPFSVSVSDLEIHNMTSGHLQRLAVFLFLRCSFSLLNPRGKGAEQCARVDPNLCLSFDPNSELECCGRKKGLSELYEWLQGHLPADMFASKDLYFERCTTFSLSFLQLYMHEDDMLFKVLMQLFCVPVSPEQRVCKERGAFQEAKEDMLFHVSNLFNPVHLFHLFLAEILYDHQVLLDYLISKDTGASFAEYLLRCLRLVCDSWNVFVEFTLEGEVINESYCKKRKVHVDGYVQGEPSSASVKGDSSPLALKKEYQKDHTYGNKRCGTNRLPFEAAKDCLLSLKRSMVNLHRKNLFPYNPEVLLRRLARFQEFCSKPQSISLQRMEELSRKSSPILS